MELRPLGRTGLRVSPIGLGTTKLGRCEQVKYPDAFALPSDEEVEGLLASARRFGVNLIDTAPAYGTSEERLGELLSDRKEWVIVGKAGEAFDGGRSHFDFTPAGIRRSVERSLERLRTDWLDVLLLHSSGDDVPILRESGALETLVSLRDEGLVRACGASTKSVEGGLLAVELRDAVDVVMLTLNRDDQSQRPVIEAARQAGVAVLIKKPLASGRDIEPGRALVELLAVPGVTSLVVGSIDRAHWEEDCAAVEGALGAGRGKQG